MFQLSKVFNLSEFTAMVIPGARMAQLLEINEESADYQLQLSAQDILGLVQERNEILRRTERIEFGFETIETIIRAFYTSPYINQFDYVETLNEIQALFYAIKNEVNDSFSDEELILLMSELFNQVCHGSLELLKGKGVEYILQAARAREEAERAGEQQWH